MCQPPPMTSRRWTKKSTDSEVRSDSLGSIMSDRTTSSANLHRFRERSTRAGSPSRSWRSRTIGWTAWSSRYRRITGHLKTDARMRRISWRARRKCLFRRTIGTSKRLRKSKKPWMKRLNRMRISLSSSTQRRRTWPLGLLPYKPTMPN